jgi:hypothetical protein
MVSRLYLLRFFKRVLVEMVEFVSGQQMFTAALLALAAFIYQFRAGRLTVSALKENAASVIFPFIWVVCGFGSYYIIKAACSLHREMVAEVEAYQPVISGYVPKKPSKLPAILASSASVAVLALLSYGTFVVAFPRNKSGNMSELAVRFPYPWVSARTTILGNPMRVQLELYVREYPPTKEFVERSILPVSTIFSVRVDLSTHLEIVEPTGEDLCSYTFRHPEFRNGLLGEGLIGYVKLDKDVTPITIRESTRNGTWDGYILLYRRHNAVDYEQVLHGLIISSVDSSEQKMTIKEARRDGHVVNDPALPDQLTTQMLKTYGVPVVGTDRQRPACPSLAF